ncbi:DNA polymerase III subunit gamma/tau [Paucilactobacillus nenjiangensis]|uniref:DNA-directed DNA polymerase n=2 Tax=Paucilactobacillus nenjiangensis TaxID=1296540 RepID=A0A5P1X2F9_9LACO|nr:DNA polymerase III subunit gamma/tau [Paucilactobacillus nenjiangensis]QER68006.1 DNA polymerase III subunit gamma/tau [Paucilactobacillus nenjiangensis]
MSYQALYRVWRPQRFDEIVGQQVITTTLKNALISNQTSHAYLFTGPRGTGKTSAAKIFAKAINCHFLKDGEPCNECETCKEITNGQLNDVIEIDAASNNGVEEIRDIRDKAKYAPTIADYKVYIIDEVHMLSTGAFNALLKTLEEPPANVVFILATTEPHKIPLTIISRTQRFDFRRISADQSFERMKYILGEKHVEYDEQALWVIARAAEGGMRDALSILDQVISFSNNKVEIENALLVTGSVTKGLLHQYVTQITDHDGAQALETMQNIMNEGKDGQRFIEDLISFIRDILLYQKAPEMVNVEITGLTTDELTQLGTKVSEEVWYQAIDTLNEIQQEMRFTTHPDVYLEVLTIKLAQLTGQPVPSQAAPAGEVEDARVDQLQQQVVKMQAEIKQLAHNKAPVATQKATKKPRVNTNKKEPKVNLTKVYPILETATKEDLVNLRDLWGDMLDMLTVPQRSMLHVSTPVAASAAGVIVSFEYSLLYQEAADDTELLTMMHDNLEKLSGSARDIIFVSKEQWPHIRQGYIDQLAGKKQAGETTNEDQLDEEQTESEENNTVQTQKDDKIVSEAQELFGEDIVEIKND